MEEAEYALSLQERLVAGRPGLGRYSAPSRYRDLQSSRGKWQCSCGLEFAPHLRFYRCISSGLDLSAPLRNQSIYFDRPLWFDDAKRNTTLPDRGSTLDQKPAGCASMVTRSVAVARSGIDAHHGLQIGSETWDRSPT